MRRERLLAALRDLARERRVAFMVNEGRGKGSHYRVTVGDRTTTIKSGDLSPRYVELILKQLGLPKDAV
ncbi:MAG: hypothetical protein KIS96_10735 [Bauldia sp.]|nr:hypothetical protein [Bauldia sp.]